VRQSAASRENRMPERCLSHFMAPGQALRSLRNCFVTALIAYHKRNRDEHNHECAIRRKHPDGEKTRGDKGPQ
jgi:hypothetical protein